MIDTSALDTYGGQSKPVSPDVVRRLYEKGVRFKDSVDVFDTVKVNENFFIGKQWEGVRSNGLPTPVFNIIKRVVCFIVATISSDNIKVTAAPLASTAGTKDLIEPARIVNEELDALTERNAIPSLVREYARNAAVDGDGCLYTWWDADAETGQNAKGAIKSEVIENTRVFFGNPNDRRVQSQPYIIVESRAIRGEVAGRAKENGFEDWETISPDEGTLDDAKRTDDKVTLLLLMWKDKKTGHVWGYECTETCGVREPWDMEIRRYPITWLNWDYVHDSYHGQAMVTGLIPNQIFINKAWAMAQLSLMTTAFPKILYDKTRVAKWDNRVGAAIGINGGDINSVAKIMDPATISPQIGQFIQLAIEETEQSLGATSVALGDTRPDNTSAIIALQRAASTPSEITKQNLYQSIEDLFRIYIEFMAVNYGKRVVDVTPPPEMNDMYAFAGQPTPAEIQVEFDFSSLKTLPMSMKLDVGASSYYSEIASIQTLDNLLRLKAITPMQYLERIPDGYIPARRELINELKTQQQQLPAGDAPMTGGTPDVPTGGGYSALQRKINETGTTDGLV